MAEYKKRTEDTGNLQRETGDRLMEIGDRLRETGERGDIRRKRKRGRGYVR